MPADPLHRSRFGAVLHSLGRMVVWAFWRLAPRLLPLPTALFVNIRFLRGDSPAPPELPKTAWAFQEQQRLLERSEERLESIEGKGPGLATVSAIVAAAIAVAISLTWPNASLAQRVVLVVSALYALMSLAAPIKLVGPIQRSTVTVDQLVAAAEEDAPEASLARACSEAAADIDRNVLRLSNLQAASRNDLVMATFLFLAWSATALLSS